MRVLFLTEGGAGKGFGHIIRSSTLAEEMMLHGWNVEFVVDNDIPESIIPKGFAAKKLAWQPDVVAFEELCKNRDIIVIDSYIAQQFHYDVASQTAKQLCFFDDTLRLDYPKGVLINGALDAERIYEIRKKEIHYLLGGSYQMLRRVFRTNTEKVIHEKVRKILITVGGNDIHNLIEPVFKTASAVFPDAHFNLIAGDAIDASSFEQVAVGIFRNCSAEQMYEIMNNSDLAISATGQTLFELAATGTPTIGIVVADNQLNNALMMQERGFLEFAGHWNDAKLYDNLSEKLKKMVSPKIREEKSKTGKNLIDGKGSQRVVEFLNELFLQNSIN